MSAPGVLYAIGQPASGKTTLALHECSDRAEAQGWPIFVLAGVDAGVPVNPATGRPFYRASTVHEALHAIAAHSPAYFSPADVGDAEAICRGIQVMGKYVLLVDECHVFMTSRKVSAPTLLVLLRTWRHVPVNVILTTQHFGDLPGEAISCAPAFRVFRTTNARSLKAIEALDGEPGTGETVKNLEQHSFLEIDCGFA